MSNVNFFLEEANTSFEKLEEATANWCGKVCNFMEALEAGMVFHKSGKADDDYYVVRSFNYESNSDVDFVAANCITILKDSDRAYDTGYDEFTPENFVRNITGCTYVGKLSLEQIKKLDIELKRRREELIREFCRDNLLGIAEA